MGDDDNNNKDEAIKVVAERLKFFFSDANIRMDKFMQKAFERKDEALIGAVPIETLLKFNSIKKHTSDVAVVVEAAKMLPDFLKLELDNKAIARVVPFKLSQMNENLPLSLMVQNLPVEKGKDGEGANKDTKPKYTVTVDQIKALFESYGEIALIKFQYRPMETSNGNNNNNNKPGKRVFVPAERAQVEFAKKEDLEKAASELLTIKAGEKVEAAKKLELGGKTLDVELLAEVVARKKQKKKEAAAAKRESTPAGKRKEQPSAGDNGDDADKEDRPTYTFDWKPGCVIQLKGLGETCNREAIRDSISEALGLELSEIKEQEIYIDYSRGQSEGAVRFQSPDDSKIKTLADKFASGDVKVSGGKVESATILEGDEEKAYWKKFIEFKNKQLLSQADKRKSKRQRR